jgi:SAM-dependent methyltransferase
VLSIWGLCGAYIVHGPLRFSRPVALPTERFLPTGSGRVLDAGAGSGLSTLMVLLSRPAAKVVALDRFTGYYAIVDNTPDQLRANARAAGADERVEIEVGDMREMPFEDGSFDGVVSVAALDHLLSDPEGESVPLRKREDVHRASFGHLRVLTWKEAIESVVHASRVTAPAAVHGEILLPVDREG